MSVSHTRKSLEPHESVIGATQPLLKSEHSGRINILYIVSFVLHFIFSIWHMVGKIVPQPQMRTLPSLSSYLTTVSRVLLQLINTTHIHHRKFIKIRSLKQKAKKKIRNPSLDCYVVFTSSLFVFCSFHILIDSLLTHFSDYIIFCHMNVPHLI